MKEEHSHYKLKELFQEAVKRNSSDLHLISGQPPTFRVDGELVSHDGEALHPSDTQDLAYSILSTEQARRFDHFKELDFAYSLKKSHRFRVNLRWQQRMVSLTARVIPSTIPKPDAITLSETIYGFTHLVDGLILVTGPAGSGKSTTLASLIDIINTERSAHIITVEDPIEFVFQSKKSMIEQREVHVDTRSFANGVKYSLRQDPDVIMVGEMRDLETVQAVLTAAETGHIVLSTLHTRGAEESLERIIDIFPPHQQNQVRLQLAGVLRGVVSQLLLPSQEGGRIAAREILIVNHAVSNLIRENELKQITSHMQMHAREGMQTMNMALQTLENEGKVTSLVARNRLGKEYGNHRYY